MKKKKKKSGGLWAGLIVIAAGIAGLFFAGKITSPVLKIIANVGIIGVMVLCVIMVLIILLARKSSQSAAPSAVSGKSSNLTPEQEKSLNDAHAQLVNARMTISRFKNSALSKSGSEACSAMDKVLQTLKEKPEKIQTSRQLFNYYIPTLEKVVSRYKRIEDGNVENAEMPQKLEHFFSDVKDAMDNLYEGLFDNDKLNVAVDMEAMTIAIKRDGLLDDEDFDKGVLMQEGGGLGEGF